MKARRRVLVKVGGAILDDTATRAVFAASVAARVAAGDDVVVVHGGGAQVTRLTDQLGLVPTRVRGLRVTDDATAAAVLMVLGGEVNARLVEALQRAGVAAVGVSGADGGLMRAEVVDSALGHVGRVVAVRGEVLTALGAGGFVPVIATVVPHDEPNRPFLNVNADDAVAPIAAAYGADVVLFLSDVPHVRAGEAQGGGRIPSIDPALAGQLEADGTIAGGMLPKVSAALDAAARVPGAVVKIATGGDASTQDPIAAALEPSVGTLFHSRGLEHA